MDEIKVKSRSNSAACLRFKLNYDYLTSSLPTVGQGDAAISTDGQNDDLKRLRLLSVQEWSCDESQSKPPYRFAYAAGALPRRLSYQRDHWGYFNGRFNNNSLIPSTIANSSFTSSNRDADIDLMKRGHLTQITYPTGGFIRFTMEAHQAGSIIKGGLRVKQLAEYFSATDSVVRSFNYGIPLEAFQRLYTQQIPMAALERWRTYIDTSCNLVGSATVKGTNLDCLVNRSLIGSHLFSELAALGGAISYQQVRVNYLNSGYSLYKYNTAQFTNQYAQVNSFPVLADNALYYVANGTLAAEEHYNQAGQIQQKTVYDYNNLYPVAITTAPAIKFVVENCPACIPLPIYGCPHEPISVFFDTYNRQSVRQLLLKKTEYRYNLDGTGEWINATLYSYGNQHQQPIRTVSQNSRGDSLIQESRFVRDLITSSTGSYTADAAVLQLMRQRNLNAPVEQLSFIKKAGQSEAQKKAIAGSYTQFGRLNGNDNMLKPTAQYSLKVADAVSVVLVGVSGGALSYASNQYEPRTRFGYVATGPHTGLLQSENAEKGARIQYSYNTYLLLASRIDAVATPQAQTTTYVHDALFGPTQIENPRGLKSYFIYDGLGRLSQVRDHQYQVVKAYDYQYYSSPNELTNAVNQYTPRVGATSVPTTYTQVQTTRGWVDGLGRGLQSVALQASPDGTADIIANAQTYDATGRPRLSYVAFAGSSDCYGFSKQYLNYFLKVFMRHFLGFH